MVEYVLVFAVPERELNLCDDDWWPGSQFKPAGGGKVLVCHKDRPAWMAGRINLPGGKIEPEETAFEAAIRELKEETGLDPCPGHAPVYHGVVEGTKSIIHHVRIVVDGDKPIVPRVGETEVCEWLRWENLKSDARLMPNLRVTIPLMRSSITAKIRWHIEDKNKYDPDELMHYDTLTLPWTTRQPPDKFMCCIGCVTGFVEYIRLREEDHERQEEQRGEGRNPGEGDRT